MARKHMIGIRKFFVFLKKYYNYTMKRFSNKKRKFFDNSINSVDSTRNSRTLDIIAWYIFLIVFLSLLFIIKGHLLFKIVIALLFLTNWYVLIYTFTEFTFSYYLFLYLYLYKKIDNEKYSINEQITSQNYLFSKSPENVWMIINKFYKINSCCSITLAEVEYSMLVREKGKKDRGIIKKLVVTKKAIYFEGKKIFGKLYDINELDSFLEESVKEEGK